jgi:Zn-dependent M28 family amino/carboxypeptidase
MAEIRKLESFGVRREGSPAERRAATYVAGRLKAMGYAPRIAKFDLPNGRTSRNVVAVAKGASPRTIVLGAHLDSKSPSPGANDNASGSAAILEIARILASTPATATVQLVWFGAEEMMDSDPNHHHFGSRHHVATMTAAQKRAAVGMISVDMIGYGSEFVTRTMERGPRSMDKLLLAKAKRSGLPMTHLKDPGSSGQSDHEAFELAGIPASWIEWRIDPVYHTARDTSAHIQRTKVRRAGQLVLDVVTTLDDAGLRKLERSR